MSILVATPAHLLIINWRSGMNNEMQIQHEEDSVADSIAAVVLIVIFVATCLFWVSGQ